MDHYLFIFWGKLGIYFFKQLVQIFKSFKILVKHLVLKDMLQKLMMIKMTLERQERFIKAVKVCMEPKRGV